MKLKSAENPDQNRIPTYDHLCNTVAVLYQLSYMYQANWELISAYVEPTTAMIIFVFIHYLSLQFIHVCMIFHTYVPGVDIDDINYGT